MPRPTLARQQDTRRLALECAHDLLHERGVHGFTMDDVAAGIGVRKASLYHHFPGGKEALIVELALRTLDGLDTRLHAALHGQSTTAQRLRAVIDWHRGGPQGTQARLREIAATLPGPHQHRVLQALITQLFTPIEQVFLDGQARGELRPHDARRMGVAFLAVLSGLDETGMPPQSDAEVTAVLTLFLRGLGAP